MIGPNLIVPALLVGVALGVVGYAYKEGKLQGTNICEATILKATLKQKEDELDISNQLTEFQQKQIDEAQTQLLEENKRNALLKLDLDKALSGKPPGCITPGMRDAILKFRATGRY